MATPGGAPSQPTTDRPAEVLPSAGELERAIGSVAGVVAAEVRRSETGRDRLRMSLAPGADPEPVAWAVAATLRERFGIALDPAAIRARLTEAAPTGEATAHPTAPLSEATVAEASAEAGSEPVGRAPSPTAVAPEAVSAPAGGRQLRRRAAIRELVAHPDGDDLDVTATLQLHDREVHGRARGVHTRRGRWRAISEATLAALDELAPGRLRANVDHVTVLTIPDLAHVTVSVTLLTDRGERSFLGASLVRDDPDRAVMRATLDAVNRHVEPWLATGS
jgi:hypothetical protein